MPNSIEYTRNYTSAIDRVYQCAGVSTVLNSGPRVVRSGRNAKEIMIPKIEVTGLGDYAPNVDYKTGAITYEFETNTFNFLPNSGERPLSRSIAHGSATRIVAGGRALALGFFGIMSPEYAVLRRHGAICRGSGVA